MNDIIDTAVAAGFSRRLSQQFKLLG